MEKLHVQSSEDLNDTMKGRYLLLTVDKESYGIEIKHVTEIISIQPITTLPEMPDYMKGIINLRGRIIPVVDMRTRLGKSPKDYDDRTCLVVINFNGGLFALIVDSVSEVLSISADELANRSNIQGEKTGYVKQIGKVNKSIVMIVDCSKLISQGIQSYIYL